ncbi:unnamed protein product [Orchesella dallaii]|uniref:Uncharacterized protein n=1 Tax=Orchesella dallaii TaxID=48710 RepID=A0ABP1R9L5_9HEXA
MAFCNTIHHQASSEMVVKTFPSHLLNFTNKITLEVGSTIVSVPNCLGDNIFETKWEAKMHYVGEKKKIIITLQYMENTLKGSSLPEYCNPKVAFQYQLQLVSNKLYSRGPVIPIKYLQSNNENNQLKLELSMTLTMVFDWGRTPSTPVWSLGKEPFTLTLYTTDGWIKTDKAVVTAKCKYIGNQLAEAGIPTAEPGVVGLADISFVGLQHVVTFCHHGHFIIPTWRRDLSLIAQACEVLQMKILKGYCDYVIRHEAQPPLQHHEVTEVVTKINDTVRYD